MFLTSRYALQRHGPKRLAVSRSLTWSEVIVQFDGVEIFRTDEAGLRQGLEHRMHDGTVLRLWLESGPRNSRFLLLTRNGHPLPGSEGDPVKVLRFTVFLVWGIAALQIGVSVMIMVLRSDRVDAGVYSMLALGAALVLLGILAWRRSVVATILGCAISFGELVVFFATQAHINIGNIWGLLVALSIFAWLLLRGINAARELKAMTLPIRRPPQAIHHSSDAS